MNKKQKDVLNILEHYRQHYSNKYGIYMNGKLVLLGNSNVYKTPGIAIRRLCEETGATKEDINQLVSMGILEFKKID